MKLIVGLGNPGDKYLLTRHNIGFLAIDRLADHLSAKEVKPSKHSLLKQVMTEKEKILLVKPQTFMNLSGQAVQELLQFYRLQLSDCLIVTDDYYLDFGRSKLLPGGGDGGHNGLKSIFSQVGKKIPRLRVGVGPSKNPDDVSEQIPNVPLEKYVLGNFNNQEQKELSDYLDFLANILIKYLKFDINDVMNQFNNRNYKEFNS